jgi:hypothetical protein
VSWGGGWGYGVPAYGYGYGGLVAPGPVYATAGYYGGGYAPAVGFRAHAVHLASYHAHRSCHCSCCR